MRYVMLVISLFMVHTSLCETFSVYPNVVNKTQAEINALKDTQDPTLITALTTALGESFNILTTDAEDKITETCKTALTSLNNSGCKSCIAITSNGKVKGYYKPE